MSKVFSLLNVSKAPDPNASSERDRPRADGCAFGPPAFLKVMELELGSGPKKNQVIKKKGSVLEKK